MKIQDISENGSLDSAEKVHILQVKCILFSTYRNKICIVCSACLESETCDIAVKFTHWKPIYSTKGTSLSMYSSLNY